MAWLLLMIQFLLCVVLLLAATGKALRPDDFASALRLSHFPARIVMALSIAIPVAEVSLVFALLVSTSRTLPFALGVTVVLFGAFCVWMILVRAQNLRVVCGCFGRAGEGVGRRTIIRTGSLVLVAAAGAYLATQVQSPLPDPSFWMVVTVTSLSTSLALLVAAAEVVPNLHLGVEQP
jgi:hypothetical protein